MLDPVTFATTFITLATFIKDLIDLGEGIQSSIEKVGENRREVWELLQDVDHTLHDLASLTKGKENIFRGPELLVALENLKAEMLHVHSKCLAVSPAQLPGFRRIGSQFKAWRRRENLEKRVTRLRERVNKCYLQFTAISAARTEHATWRIEQTLILDNVETQVKVRRLEGMMAQLLLESDFGRLKINNTMEIISTDSSFSTLESQYLSAQLRSLINTLNQLLLSGRLLSESPLWDNDLLQFEFLEPSRVTPSHTLVQILRIIVEIKSQANPSVLLELLKLAMEELPICLGCIGMHSEAIVWGHLEIDFLRHTARTGHSTGTLPRVASALCEISLAHYRRANFDSAAEFSQQSLAIWVQISHMLPEVDNGIGLLESLVTHAKILLERDDQTALLSAAQEAASLGHSLAKTLIEAIALGGLPLTSHEEFTAVCCYDSFFMLGHVLASLDRLLDSYNSFKEGFQTACSLPVSGAPPPGKCINEFIEVVCKLADSGRLSLRMLVDIVVLFWNLTRVHCEQFSHKFLRLLHAFAYFMQQYHSPSSIIRLFLIPKSNHPPPGLDLAKPIRIDLCVLEDAVKIFFTEASEEYTIPLIGNIWVAHFQQAINTLQTQRLSLDLDSFEWVLHTTREILPFLSKTNYVALLRVLSVSIEHLRTNFVTPIPERELYFVDPIEIICKHALKIGAVDEGLRLCEQITEYLECQSHTNQNADPWLGWFLRLRIFILCDGTRFFDAIQLVQHTEAVLPTSASNGGAGFLNYYLVKARILGRLGRHKEALHFVRKGVASVLQVFKTNGPFFNLHFYLLCIEQAAVGSCMGIQQTALADAERAVVACQEVNIKGSVEEISCVQIHSLTTLSNCLASIGRDDEALNAAQKAVSLYTPNAEEMWKDFVFTIRRQELGGNTFFALSRRLETSGDKESALSSCEKAIELYHELVSLAPRHLPTLASSLQHMASILWDLGRQQEAMAASMEAVQILRKVADSETYFLPTVAEALHQLARFLAETGYGNGAGAATDEAGEARMRFAALPPGPEWLFEEVVDSDLSTEEELEWWKWQPETYHDAVTDFASEEPVATAGRDGVGPEVNEQHRSALQNATSIQEMICEPPVIRIEPRSVSSAAPNGCEYDAANCTAAMPSIVESSSRLEEKYASVDSLHEFRCEVINGAIIIQKGSYHGLWTGMVVKDILAEPERQEIKLSMSRLMNVVLGILLGLLFAITGILFKN